MISGLNHITLAVTNIDTSFEFYSEVLGLKPLAKWDKGAYFLAGDFWFCLNVDEARRPAEDYTHYAFSVDQKAFLDMKKKIEQAGYGAFKENTSPGDSFYFADPDGHKLEIHTQNYKDRVAEKKKDAGQWQNVEWFI